MVANTSSVILMFKLPVLPYHFSALEPHIDAKTMEIHHDKHHAGYVNNLNAALEGKDDLLAMDIEDILANLDTVPEDIRTTVRNNGGGHYNHSLFWKVMSPQGGGEPLQHVSKALLESFKSFEHFQEEFAKAATTRFGSGWAWLVVDDGKLEVMSTANQDSPLSVGKKPILGLDVWEHAYYLHYQNKRPDYIDAWWNVVNWEEVERQYQESS